MKINILIDLSVNRVVKYFVLGDLALLAGWGLVNPIFALFFAREIEGATISQLGFAVAFYWILKSLLQLPIAKYLDRDFSDQKSLRFLLVGLLLASFNAFIFVLASKVWHIYILQIVHAFAFSLYIPAWAGIFSRHLDREKISFDWSLDNTAAGLAVGVSSFFGGMIAHRFGFDVIFVIAGCLSLLSAFILFLTPDLALPKPSSKDFSFQNRGNRVE